MAYCIQIRVPAPIIANGNHLRLKSQHEQALTNEYPFWFNTGRVLELWHTGSMTRRIPILHKAMPQAYVEINPEDAATLGITNGNQVKTF